MCLKKNEEETLPHTCEVYLLQLTPTLADFKGPTICICYRRIFVIAIIKIKEKLFKGLRIVSVIGEFPLQAGPLEQDSTYFKSNKQNLCVVGVLAVLVDRRLRSGVQ